jgi:hypothetical protein
MKYPQVRAEILKDDLSLPRESKPVFDKRYLYQTNEQQLHFKVKPISELHGQIDSIQTSLKLLFNPLDIMECRLCLSAQPGSHMTIQQRPNL